MPTIFSHGLIGLTGSQFVRPPLQDSKRWIFIGLSIALPILPDLDGIPLLLGWLPYGHIFGHRGFCHSLFAAALIAAAATAFMARLSPGFRCRWPVMWLYFTALTATHGILDMATLGGKGIALFAPFDNTRYFFPFRPIHASPMNPINFMSRYGLNSIVSELLTIWTICLALLISTRRFSGLIRSISSGITKAAYFIEQRLGLFVTIFLITSAIMSWLILSVK
jgi:inner membrane protein